jgi:hypothetical protein
MTLFISLALLLKDIDLGLKPINLPVENADVLCGGASPEEDNHSKDERSLHDFQLSHGNTSGEKSTLPVSCENFPFPDPVDPFGKASGRNLLTMGLSRLNQLLELTQGGFDLFSLLVNQTRLLKP